MSVLQEAEALAAEWRKPVGIFYDDATGEWAVATADSAGELGTAKPLRWIQPPGARVMEPMVTSTATPELVTELTELMVRSLERPEIWAHFERLYVDPNTGRFPPGFTTSGAMAGFLGAWANAGAPLDQESFDALLLDWLAGIRSAEETRRKIEIHREIEARRGAERPAPRERGPAMRPRWRGVPGPAQTGGAKVEPIHHRFRSPAARLLLSRRDEQKLLDEIDEYLAEEFARRGRGSRRGARQRDKLEFSMTEGPGGTVSVSGRQKRRRKR